jgi:hypothetical protein
MLLPGSEIFSFSGVSAEPLTGSFTWLEYDCGTSNGACFDAIALDFRSGSYTLRLNTTINDKGTSVFDNPHVTFFGEIVDLTGLDVPVADMSGDGTYTGPAEHPDSLSYSAVMLSPVGGGAFFARLKIFAIAVPEDSDSDGDGILNASDQCSHTPTGAIVNDFGCSIDQLVPCGGPLSGRDWTNHGEYVSAITRKAKLFVASELITEDQRAVVLRNAARSSCGKDGSF